MKKTSLLILALLLCLAVTAQAAEPAGPAGLAVRPAAQTREDAVGNRGGTGFPQPRDTVQIENGVFIITSQGITAEFQVPFGWIGLTQDISKQLTDYALMENPLGVLDLLIQNEISLLAVEPQTNANMFAFFVADGVSMLLQDLQIPEMQAIALTTYEGEAVRVGERSYVRLIEDGTLIYFTVLNGVRAGFQLVLAGAEPTPEEEETLAAFVEMTVFRQS